MIMIVILSMYRSAKSKKLPSRFETKLQNVKKVIFYIKKEMKNQFSYKLEQFSMLIGGPTLCDLVLM